MQYTIGVRAWKQWLISKNEQIEQAATTAHKKAKLFNTNILKLTTDELNYLLCMFVKEVRKPNGMEYAPDTIYYLCLSIQQYLFENGRIDNIFTDSFYEPFTNALDEVARKFSDINDATRKYFEGQGSDRICKVICERRYKVVKMSFELVISKEEAVKFMKKKSRIRRNMVSQSLCPKK